MTPAFSSWQAFFSMNGYATSVWPAVLLVVVAMLVLSGFIFYQQRQTEKNVLRQLKSTQQTQAEYQE
ncbi:heme exporter protein CcmD [Saezia sanguinis]|uniref:heme exporter protein CcmD n=1 Tax=Saezia sanguinis TaxID=1965230 RepID=UPI003059E48B